LREVAVELDAVRVPESPGASVDRNDSLELRSLRQVVETSGVRIRPEACGRLTTY